jgi:microcystin-dependent protein
VPIHMGGGFTLGQRGGEYSHTITTQEMAQHNHSISAKNAAADTGAGGNTPASTKALAQARAAIQGGGSAPVSIYGTGGTNQAFHPSTIGNTGGSQPHTNQQPYLTLSFCIALQGIFPSQT